MPSTRSGIPWGVSPSELTRYLDFDSASRIIDRARVTAAARGAPNRAPPFPLEQCDSGKLEAALAGPRAGFGEQKQYPTLELKAAVLAYRIVKAHACPKGNKRIAILLLHAFLSWNGMYLSDERTTAADMIYAAAESKPEEEEAILHRLSEWIAQAMMPRRGGTHGSA